MADTNPDIRWKQRYENFERAYRLLEEALNIDSPSDTERAGLIQFFEVSFELAWKLMKDYLQEEGYTVQSPKDTLKQAFQANIITDGHVWIDALDDRNLSVHTYDETTALKIEGRIRLTYFPLLRQLYEHFEAK